MGTMKRLKDIQNELVKITQKWASGDTVNLDQVKELRGEAIRINHAHYLENIPLYRKFAIEEGCNKDVDIETIKKNLMFAADVFKSYEQSWLDNGDFGRMTQWLSSIYHKDIDADVFGVESIDDWIECLDKFGVHVVYSSGTSGAFSFVPRDREDWELSRTTNIVCLSPLLARRISTGLSQQLLKSTVRLMTPDAFARLAAKKGLPEFDAAFLGFRQGRMGNQALIKELTPLFHRHYFLYDIDITGTVLRCLRRGARTDKEQQLIEKLQTEVIGHKEKNFLRLIENIQKSTKDGQKVFIFGAPYQFKELCEVTIGNSQRLDLEKGSLVFFGGGWKSFTGEEISRDTLVDMLTKTLNILPQMVLEGYSMTEINVLMLRCEHGLFHVPPIVEPVIFDEELNPLEGSDVKGTFGFLDPLAASYPGFIISSDYVRMVDGKCDCGLAGPAITEIGRLASSEIKGCGGIMSSIQA
jgi:hypothetical protein